MAKLPGKDELLNHEYDFPSSDWMDTEVEIKPVSICYGAKAKIWKSLIS
jgi:hypothetical protein